MNIMIHFHYFLDDFDDIEDESDEVEVVTSKGSFPSHKPPLAAPVIAPKAVTPTSESLSGYGSKSTSASRANMAHTMASNTRTKTPSPSPSPIPINMATQDEIDDLRKSVDAENAEAMLRRQEAKKRKDKGGETSHVSEIIALGTVGE